MTRTPDLDLRLVVVSQPDLIDQAAAVRGLAFGVLLSIPLWFAIGWVVQIWMWAL